MKRGKYVGELRTGFIRLKWGNISQVRRRLNKDREGYLITPE
jgi:hypothetical protein